MTTHNRKNERKKRQSATATNQFLKPTQIQSQGHAHTNTRTEQHHGNMKTNTVDNHRKKNKKRTNGPVSPGGRAPTSYSFGCVNQSN